MDNFSYFHLCDHRIKRSPREGEVVKLRVENGKDLIDIVINGGVVLNILEVRAIEYDPEDAEIIELVYDNDQREQTYEDVDPGDAYYDHAEPFVIEYAKYFPVGATISDPLPTNFYEPMLHNRIKWAVKPPLVYEVTANVRYTAIEYDYYAPRDCPVCNGKAWFVDIFNKNGEFQKLSGVLRIAQRIIKDFLTDEGSHILDLSYGTTVKKRLLDYGQDDEQLFNALRMEVSTVEDNYLTNQQDRILQLKDEEILQSVLVDEVRRSTKKPSVIIVRLRIITLVEDQTFQFTF